MRRSKMSKKIAVVLLAVLTLSFSALVFGAGKRPLFATKKIGDGVYHFRFGGTNAMFVVTDEGVVVLDTINTKVAPIYLKEIRKITSKPIKFLVYSHPNTDHITGGEVFKREGAVFIAPEAALDRLKMLNDPEIISPDITFKDKMSLVVGGKKIELLHLGPSHTEGYTVMYLPQDKIITAIDIAYYRRLAFYFLPDFHPRAWLRTLREMEKMDFNLAISGHGPLVNKAEFITFADYLDDLITQVGKVYKKYRYESPAVVVPKALKEVNLDKYKEWGRYQRYRDLNIMGVLFSFSMGY